MGKRKILHGENKLARLLLDFGDVNTIDDDVATVAVCLQQLTAPTASRRSCSVYNRCGLMPC